MEFTHETEMRRRGGRRICCAYVFPFVCVVWVKQKERERLREREICNVSHIQLKIINSVKINRRYNTNVTSAGVLVLK